MTLRGSRHRDPGRKEAGLSSDWHLISLKPQLFRNIPSLAPSQGEDGGAQSSKAAVIQASTDLRPTASHHRKLTPRLGHHFLQSLVGTAEGDSVTVTISPHEAFLLIQPAKASGACLGWLRLQRYHQSDLEVLHC